MGVNVFLYQRVRSSPVAALIVVANVISIASLTACEILLVCFRSLSLPFVANASGVYILQEVSSLLYD